MSTSHQLCPVRESVKAGVCMGAPRHWTTVPICVLTHQYIHCSLTSRRIWSLIISVVMYQTNISHSYSVLCYRWQKWWALKCAVCFSFPGDSQTVIQCGIITYVCHILSHLRRTWGFGMFFPFSSFELRWIIDLEGEEYMQDGEVHHTFLGE